MESAEKGVELGTWNMEPGAWAGLHSGPYESEPRLNPSRSE